MKKIRVYGCSKDPETKNLLRRAAIYFLNDQLPRKRKIDIKITCEDDLIVKENIYGECHHVDRSKYWIRLNSSMSIYDVITTLAHEFVHVRQFDTGQLALRYSCNRWNGTYYPCDEFFYEDEPWELEAQSLENSMASNFWLSE